METITVSTEVWDNGVDGIVVKAVVRRADGTFVGATNQTKVVRVSDPRPAFEVIGK